MPTSSRLTDPMFGSAATLAAFSDAGTVQRMLDFEAALARAEARCGVIPAEAAEVIAATCLADEIDFDALAAAAVAAGNLAIPLVRQLTARVAARDEQAARYVHWGATSQDAIDTGMVLQLREALQAVDADLKALGHACAALAMQHRDTPMVARTWLQHALPTTFGLKAAGWLDALRRDLGRLGATRAQAAALQFGGAAGTLASLGDAAPAVAAELGRELSLAVPATPWHAYRDRMVEVATTLGMLTGSLGKIARDVSLMMQTEVAEVAEPSGPGRGGSSTMPHKRNPVGCAAVLTAAVRVPPLVATMLAGMVQEHERALGGWQAEWDTLPQIVALAAGALRQMLEVVNGLQVDAARMRANLGLTHGLILAEAAMLELGGKIGRLAAHHLVEGACRRAVAEGTTLREALGATLAGDAAHAGLMDAAALDRVCDPANYAGQAGGFVDAALAAWRQESTDTPGSQPQTLNEYTYLNTEPNSLETTLPFITHAGNRLFYTLEGPASAPVLIFSNSLGTDHTMWAPQAEALGQQFRILRYDTRGHGQSELPPGPSSVAELGSDVIALMDALQIRKAAFCGLSMGGLTGMWLGVNAPQRFSRIVLANTAPKIGTPEAWNTRIEGVLRDGMAPLVEGSLQRWFTPSFVSAAGNRLDDLRKVLTGLDARGYAANCAAVRDADLREAVRTIPVPVLVIAGSADPSTTAAEGRALADAIPGTRYLELEAAHLSNREQPERFTEALLDFLGDDAQKAANRSDSDGERYQAGLAVRREVLGSAHVDRSLARLNSLNDEFQNLITRYAWGEIWTREGLPRHTRSLITIAMMVALNRSEELKLHLRAAANNNVSREEIKEVLLQTAIYCGVPAANSAFHMAEEVFAVVDAEALKGL